MILSDSKVKAVLFNIFGGITRCDEVAKGLIEAFGQVQPDVPFVVRLDGTNDVEGRRLLAEAELPGLEVAATMQDAAKLRRRASRRRAEPGAGAMSILIDADTRLCVAGITGREGTFHAMNNKNYGTQVVAGVTPGKRGQDVEGVPVFNTFHEAVAETDADTAMIFVPAALRRRLDPRGRRRRHRAGHLHHRGHPGPRRAAGRRRRSGPRARGSSAPTAPACSRPARPTSASSRPPSSRRATSAWSRARAR